MGHRSARAVSIGVALVAVAPLAWWVSMAIPDEVPEERLEYADYALRPPDLSGDEKLTIGLISLTLVLGGATVLANGITSGRMRREWLGVLLPPAALAAYAGLTYRIGTAPVSGANIGFGMLALGAFVVVPVLGTIALVYGLRLTPDRSRPGPGR